MFVLDDTGEFNWPVKVKVPVDGGKFKPQTFTARFCTLEGEEQDAIWQLPMTKQNRAQVSACLVGWGEDVKSADGEPLEFSEDARDRMAGIPYLAAPIVEAYWDAQTGKKAARKN